MPTRDPRAPSPPPGPPPPAADEDRKPFLLRLPPSLLSELRAWAAQDLRSLNGHIEWILREAVRRRRKGKPA